MQLDDLESRIAALEAQADATEHAMILVLQGLVGTPEARIVSDLLWETIQFSLVDKDCTPQKHPYDYRKMTVVENFVRAAGGPHTRSDGDGKA